MQCVTNCIVRSRYDVLAAEGCYTSEDLKILYDENGALEKLGVVRLDKHLNLPPPDSWLFLRTRIHLLVLWPRSARCKCAD